MSEFRDGCVIPLAIITNYLIFHHTWIEFIYLFIFPIIESIRFDKLARRSLKLDSFIQCCVMLRGLTDAFRARDTNLNGNITINYEDFMCMVLLNKP